MLFVAWRVALYANFVCVPPPPFAVPISAAVTAGGKLWIWGFGEEGQLGVSSETSQSEPVPVS